MQMQKVMLLLLAFLGFMGCLVEESAHKEPLKDLSEQMDVLAILQETIGQDLKKGDYAGALRMAKSMDSVLQICSETFVEHQRLKEPFRHFYETKMEKAIRQLLQSIRRRDSIEAGRQYQFLVKRCNSCHNENEVAERAHL